MNSFPGSTTVNSTTEEILVSVIADRMKSELRSVLHMILIPKQTTV